MKVLLYGLQRSGTNFLATTLEQNYYLQVCNKRGKSRTSPLQKHCRFYANKDLIPHPDYRNDLAIATFEECEALLPEVPEYYLVISKDPYSWYLSYCDWAKKCNWPEVSHHYIEEYNLFYEFFLKLAARSDKFIFIKYAELLEDTRAVLHRLEATLRVKRKSLARLMLNVPGKVSQSQGFSSDRKAFYLNERYLEQYSTEELDRLNHHLDPQVVSALGYEVRHSNSG